MRDFREALAQARREVDGVLAELLADTAESQSGLLAAMRYAVLGGGKRLRPFFVLEGAGICGASRSGAVRVGVAVELVHGYSLVHDDLPAMDDDDVRRGQPTVHRRYDEATAILVGDACQALAFEVLADPATHPDGAVRAELVGALARAAGPRGMAEGQMLDLSGAGAVSDLAAILRMQRLKTGVLIAFSCVAGAILAGAPAVHREALETYGRHLGLAFQITDDLLDAEGDVRETGKAVGKDETHGKATLVTVLGIAGARAEADRLCERAVEALDIFGPRADLLRAAARFIAERRA